MSRTLITTHIASCQPPTSDSSTPAPVPTSLSLSIPFFSRSSSSTAYSTDLDTSLSTNSSSSSPGLGLCLHPNYLYQSQDLRKSSSSSSSRSLRPSLRKMPSWNNQTWSPRTSQDVYIRRGSEQSEMTSPTDGEFVFPPGEQGRRRRSLMGIDFGTWGMKPKIIFSNANSKRKSLSISRLRLKSTTISSAPAIPVGQDASPSKADEGQDSENDLTFSPLHRVWARSGSEAQDQIQGERERRGSDWPPTQSREMFLDLSGIPTFSGTGESNELFAEFEEFSFSDSSDVGDQDVPAGGLPMDGMDVDEKRVDTPLEMPLIPRLNLRLRKSHSSSVLSPVLDTEEEEEKYNPQTVKADVQVDVAHQTENICGKANEEEEQLVEMEKDENQIEIEEYYTPSFIPSSSFTSLKVTYPSRSTNSNLSYTKPDDTPSPVFDLSIFSPRPSQPHAPVLKGIIDGLPISPLELPSNSTSLREIALSFPTPVLFRDPPNSPITTVVMPIPRRGMPNTSIESVLNAHTQQKNPISRRSSLTDRERRPSRPSTTIEGLPTTRRRMSLILKPSILPCPTPPSLLTSPKSLDSEYIPPLFSPSSISPTSSKFGGTAAHSLAGGLPVRRGRGSLKLKLPPSHFANSAGLGFGPEKDEGDEKEREEHVPTPGTFGLEGEKERFEGEKVEGDNPYFA
ncbi:hypothetical protein I302_101438 [Kwoniella bestiolae CBS 10118]|uniref:Uncharacterized protein n=1 Tax=Kwoniella bestiolae CBS 10118 TaxID=1296100 RepID=A0A1B9GC79_9TREE|nr:hypothetical protein I302_00122 [Kwoniella bestiolae CBS 10118]OCF28633.1 hypothetical protein I302_00122 [Kwoniella bestiolae CBS 10118]